MPRALKTRHELDQLTIAANEKMRRDFEILNGLIIRMIGRIEGIGEQRFDAAPTEFTGRQRNIVDN